MKTCVFAGTFDPITIGHEYVIKTCQNMFDKVVVAIGINKDKTPFFSLDERLEILNETFKGANVEVKFFDGFLADFMKENNYVYFARGIRDEKDFLYEEEMARFNENRNNDMVTFFLPTPKGLEDISSSRVKELIISNKDFKELVPVASYNAICKVISKRK